jgi:murein DD-endopeptidase MepM/ murein hydrolase activator NlpD
VRAVCGGRVAFAGSVPRGGRTVSVGCGTLVATYQHLAALAVHRGQRLPAGAPVGTVGRSGLPRGAPPHLHLGAREADGGRYVDPLGLFAATPRTSPPLAAGPRRPVPLGPAPRPSARRVIPRLIAPPPALVPAREPRGAPAPAPPFVVWVGLAACGLGLPLGGLVTHRRRRRRRAPAPDARARRWAAAHR